jgi:hypothetical protein
MDVAWNMIIWQQFGAAIDSFDDALHACPDGLWHDRLWDDPSEAQEYSEIWFIVFHTLVWLDRYLSGSPKVFTPPAPFLTGRLPEKPYTKDELQGYLQYCRQKCQVTLEAMTDEKAVQICKFPWDNEMDFAELQLYNMRHVQEHAAQLNLHLGHKGIFTPDWVSRARIETA